MSLTNKILIGLGISISSILIFVIVVFGIASFLTSGLKMPIEKQLEAIRMEDYATAYSYTTRAFQDATTFENFKTFINSYPALRNNKSIQYNDRRIENNIGTVKATLVSRGGVETPAKYRLVKENNVWKIEAFVLQPEETDDTETTTPHPTSLNNSTPSHSANPSLSPNMTNQAPTQTTSTSTYENKNLKFSLLYPSNWVSVESSQYNIEFKNNASDKASINVYYLDVPGYHHSVSSYISDLTTALKSKSTNFSTIDQGNVPLHANNQALKAKYIIYNFTVQGIELRTLAIVYYVKEKSALYILTYSNPLTKFNDELLIAKSMIESFNYLNN